MVEIGTKVCRTPAEVRAELVRLRGTVMELAGKKRPRDRRGRHASVLVLDDAGDHAARALHRREGRTSQDLAQQLLIFGTHVHIGIEDRDFLIDAMNVARYFLPHVLCLSTSSPFWMGRDTGLKSYRSIIFRNFPRTGIPPILESWADYDDAARHAGAHAAASPTARKIWWDVRPQPQLSRRSSSASATSARAWTRPSASPRSCRRSSPRCGSCGATT